MGIGQSDTGQSTTQNRRIGYRISWVYETCEHEIGLRGVGLQYHQGLFVLQAMCRWCGASFQASLDPDEIEWQEVAE